MPGGCAWIGQFLLSLYPVDLNNSTVKAYQQKVTEQFLQGMSNK